MRYGLNPLEQVLVVGLCTTDLHVFHPTPPLARMFHESLTATTDMAVLPGVLGCRSLRCTVQVRLGTNTLRLPGGTPIFVVS